MRLTCPGCWGSMLGLACVVATVTAQEPKNFPGNKPEKVEPAADGTLVLPASKCEVYGKTLEYMPEDKALGWWNSADDRAMWKLGGVKAGKYDVWFEWSCADESAGNTFVLKARDHELKGKIPTTGSWQKHKKAKFGTIELAGRQHESGACGGREDQRSAGRFS